VGYLIWGKVEETIFTSGLIVENTVTHSQKGLQSLKHARRGKTNWGSRRSPTQREATGAFVAVVNPGRRLHRLPRVAEGHQDHRGLLQKDKRVKPKKKWGYLGEGESGAGTHRAGSFLPRKGGRGRGRKVLPSSNQSNLHESK